MCEKEREGEAERNPDFKGFFLKAVSFFHDNHVTTNLAICHSVFVIISCMCYTDMI